MMNKWFCIQFMRNARMIRALAAVLMTFLLCWTGFLSLQAASADDWHTISGTYNKEASDQYNSGKLQLLPLENGGVMFELDVMQGSESEDATTDFNISGTFQAEEDGTGVWEEETEDGLVSLQFVFNGDTVKISQTGTLPVPVEGTYVWLEEHIEIDPNETAEALAPDSSDTEEKETGNPGSLLLFILVAMLIIGVVILVLINQKRKHSSP